jgi:hypothetical protein
MRPSHFWPACLGPIIFSAGPSRGSKTPITTTVHRDLSSSGLWQVPAAIPASNDAPAITAENATVAFSAGLSGTYFFRRVAREAPKPRSRPPSLGTFHRPACDRFRRPSPHRRCARHHGGKCDHRIFGRPVWDQLFFGGSVRTEMSLHVLAYNLKRMITIFGVAPLMAAIRT